MAIILPNINGVPRGTAQLFSSDLVFATWAANGGSPTSGSGSTFTWTAPSLPGVFRITATQGLDVAFRDIIVPDMEWPFDDPSLPVEGEMDDRTLMSVAEDGTRRGRRKSGDKNNYPMNFNQRTEQEFTQAIAFLRTVGKLVPFAMRDPVSGVKLAWYRDSKVTFRYNPRCGIDYSFRAAEA